MLSYTERKAANEAERKRTTKFRESSVHSDASLMKTIGVVLRHVRPDYKITDAAKKDVVAYVRKVEDLGGAKEIVKGLPGTLGKSAQKSAQKDKWGNSTGAVIEYIIAEIMELSGDKAHANKRTTIKPDDILLAIAADPELAQLFFCRCA
jgi:hypothetical protein